MDLYTQGKDIKDCIAMAKDCIGIWGISQEDAHREIPKGVTRKPKAAKNEVVTLVDVDFTAYREKNALH